jgi:hypothetical protein
MLCCLKIKAPSTVASTRDPFQILFLVDASNDMGAAVLQNVQISINKVLEMLEDKDLLSIVSFSTEAKPLIPLQPLGGPNRTIVQNALALIRTDQPRNLSDGLQKAADQFNRYKSTQCAGRYLFIVTKNNPTAGVTDKAKVLSQAASIAAKYTCSISTFGYDRFFDEDFLIELARIGKGRAYFTEEENLKYLYEGFLAEGRRITRTAISGLILEVVLPSGSVPGRVWGGLVQNNKILVADIQAQDSMMVVFEIKGRPAKKKDISIYGDYIKKARLTSAKCRLYIDCPIGTGSTVYNPVFAPVLIDFSILDNLSETIKTIEDKNSSARRDYATRFKEVVKKLEQDNGSCQNGLNIVF